MKILYVNVMAAEENNESGTFIKNIMVPLLRRNLNLVKQKDTEVTFRFARWGVTGMDASFYSYLDHLNARLVFHAAIDAEKEGFEGVLVGCFGDPMLWELRQALNIPVAGIGESSMLLSTIMGYKFGIVAISPYNIPGLEHAIAKYGLKDRLSGITPIPENSEEQQKAMTDVRQTIESFKIAARELIIKGAEIIIPGCALMSAALRLAAGAEKEYPNGFVEIDGVPIADTLADTIKLLEILVNLKNASSTWISRKGLFATASPKAMEYGQKVLTNNEISFWDC